MVFKQDDLLAKVCAALHSEFPYITFETLQKFDCNNAKRIIQLINDKSRDKRLKHPSDFLRYIKRKEKDLRRCLVVEENVLSVCSNNKGITSLKETVCHSTPCKAISLDVSDTISGISPIQKNTKRKALSLKRNLLFSNTLTSVDNGKLTQEVEVPISSNIIKVEDNKSFDNSFTSKIQDISFDDFDISQTLQNLSTATMDDILPKGSQTSSRKFDHTYRDCIVLEGAFKISDKQWNSIYTDKGFIPQKYEYYFRNRLVKYVNNVCQVVFKYKKYVKKTNTINIYLKCIYKNCKKFKISVDIRKRYATVTSSSINYCHVGPKKTAYVKGLDRIVVKKNLCNKTPYEYKKSCILKSNKKLTTAGNLQSIKSDCTIRKIKSESYGRLDRDKDDVMDLIKMQKSHSEYVKQVCFPFSVKLYSLEQLRIAYYSKSRLLHFDATGGVVRNPFDSKRVYLYTGVIQVGTSKRLCSVFDMVSSHHFAKSILQILQDFRIFCEEHNKWPLFSGVVTDFSFANLHALSLGFNRIPLAQYLHLCFKMMISDNYHQHRSKLVFIHLCCAHFLKMVVRDLDKHYTEPETKIYLKRIITVLLSLKKIGLVKDCFLNLVILLSTRNSVEIERALQNLKLYVDQTTVDDKLQVSSSDEINLESPYYESKHDKSPFLFYFDNMAQQNYGDINGNSKNIFFSQEYLQVVITKYMAYFPLWSSIYLADYVARVSNAPVENYFGFLKHNILQGQKNLKCSRLVRKIREHVLFVKNELNLEIPKDDLTNRSRNNREHKLSSQIPSLHKSQETWSKKKSEVSFKFSGSFLKNEKGGDKLVQSIEDETKCIYCGGGAFNETTEWVQCDCCGEWVHQECEPNVSFTGEFNCKICVIDRHLGNTEQDKILHTKLPELCQTLLCKITLNAEQRCQLEKQTKGQYKNKLWMSERQMRVTASTFGQICMVRSKDSYQSLVKNILQNKQIITNAISHGKEFEDTAIKKYEICTGMTILKSGLVIHPHHAYIAGSPDGLVGEEGIIEVKCPYSTRFLKPEESKYFNKDGVLSTKHKHFYQIQGLLQITCRKWCDYVVYTFKGIKIYRIFKDDDFWNIQMFPKLREFYYFYLLPQIVNPLDTIPVGGRRWKVFRNQPNFFKNGLFDDINYYKSLGNRNGYTIATFEQVNSPVKEIIFEDFATLDPGSYISGFVIDVALCILNTENLFTVLTTPYSHEIFKTHSAQENAFPLSVKLRGRIVMPVHVDGNHWCLAIIDCDDKTFNFINPIGSTFNQSKIYLKKFISYIQYVYNKQNDIEKIDCSDWKIIVSKHIIQKDGYNCGAYIIYYFSQITRGLSLTDWYDMDVYRQDIKQMILMRSDPVHNLCPYCGRSTNAEHYMQCSFCKRHFHLKCLIFRKEEQIIQDCNVCKLCQLY